MLIQIAVIGSAPMVEQIQDLVNKSEKNIKITPYIYSIPSQSPNLVDSVQNGTNVIIFTGPIPYILSMQKTKERKIPAIYIPVNELSILYSLYFVWEEINQKSQNFSIDVPELEILNNVLRELNLDMNSIYLKEYDTTYSIEKVIDFHYNLWKSNEIKFVLTSIRAVDEKLKELGVKSYRLIIPNKNIEETLQKAITKGELEVSKSSQITVGIFSIDNFNEIVSKDSVLSGQEMILKLHQILIDFSKQFHASVLHLGKDQFIIYATRGGLSRVTKQYTEMSVLSHISNFIGINVSVGFGFGTTSQEAEQNAYIATYKAKEITGSNAFIVTDSKQVIGPLNRKYMKHYLRSNDKIMLTLSEKTNLSISTLSTLSNFFSLTNYSVFSSNDLSMYTQFSKRSSERIVKKLLDCNLIRKIGTEQPYQRGRPRTTYKLNIDEWNKT